MKKYYTTAYGEDLSLSFVYIHVNYNVSCYENVCGSLHMPLELHGRPRARKTDWPLLHSLTAQTQAHMIAWTGASCSWEQSRTYSHDSETLVIVIEYEGKKEMVAGVQVVFQKRSGSSTKVQNYKSDKIRKDIPAQSSKHIDSQNIKQTCSTSNSQLFLARFTLVVHCRMKYCKSYKRIKDEKTHRLTLKKKSKSVSTRIF